MKEEEARRTEVVWESPSTRSFAKSARNSGRYEYSKCWGFGHSGWGWREVISQCSASRHVSEPIRALLKIDCCLGLVVHNFSLSTQRGQDKGSRPAWVMKGSPVSETSISKQKTLLMLRPNWKLQSEYRTVQVGLGMSCWKYLDRGWLENGGVHCR